MLLFLHICTYNGRDFATNTYYRLLTCISQEMVYLCRPCSLVLDSAWDRWTQRSRYCLRLAVQFSGLVCHLGCPGDYSLPLYIINCLTHVGWILAPELEIRDVNFFAFIVAELPGVGRQLNQAGISSAPPLGLDVG